MLPQEASQFVHFGVFFKLSRGSSMLDPNWITAISTTVAGIATVIYVRKMAENN